MRFRFYKYFRNTDEILKLVRLYFENRIIETFIYAKIDLLGYGCVNGKSGMVYYCMNNLECCMANVERRIVLGEWGISCGEIKRNFHCKLSTYMHRYSSTTSN